MQHVRIATYDIKEGDFQAVADISRKGMLETFQEQPGFIRFGVADCGDSKFVSLSLWESRREADNATPVAQRWVSDNVGDKVTLSSTVIGDLAFFEGTPAVTAS